MSVQIDELVKAHDKINILKKIEKEAEVSILMHNMSLQYYIIMVKEQKRTWKKPFTGTK